MVCKERAEALLKTVCRVFLTIVYNTPFIILVIFVTIMFDEARPKVLCIHTKLIIVGHRLRAVKKERPLVVYVCHVCCGSKNSIMFYFAQYYIISKTAS